LLGGCSLVLALLFFGFVHTQHAKPQDAVVKVTCKTSEGKWLGHGSAVILSPTEYLTAKHVPEFCYAAKGRLYVGDEILLWAAKSSKSDLALLKAKNPAFKQIYWAVLGNSWYVGDAVNIVGYPETMAYQTTTHGVISAFGISDLIGSMVPQPVLFTDAEMALGNSGGGLFDSEGNLIGIVSALMWSDSGIPWGMSVAVPLEEIKGFLDVYGGM